MQRQSAFLNIAYICFDALSVLAVTIHLHEESSTRALVRTILLSSLALLAVLSPASAHPLGNFTINHLAKIRVENRILHVRYILDVAEIPSFQIMRTVEPNGTWTPRSAARWAQSQAALVTENLTITSDGKPLPLSAFSFHARTRPGAGGLPLLYFVGDFQAPMGPAAVHRVDVTDHVYAGRQIGWKDIVIAPQAEPTHELLNYPSQLIGSPRDITSVSFEISAGGSIERAVRASSGSIQQQNSGSLVRQTFLSEMFLRSDQGFLWVLITIVAAFGFGALHAIEPGHGKALLAFTLVGARATTKQAAILAASLTLAHTIGVVALGIVLFFVTGFVPETIYPWITLISGIVIAIVGARALSRYVRGTRRFEHAHTHAHAGAHPHAHDHEHGSSQHHSHSHAIPGDQPLNFRSAVWAAMSGGIAPCPAAIILLIAAVNSHRIGYGLLLIVIFGLGLASVLTGLGIAVVRGAAWIASNAKYGKAVRFGPLISATLVGVIGSVLLGQGFVQVGIHTNAFLVAVLTLCAIAGFALSNHSHGTQASHVHAA